MIVHLGLSEGKVYFLHDITETLDYQPNKEIQLDTDSSGCIMNPSEGKTPNQTKRN